MTGWGRWVGRSAACSLLTAADHVFLVGPWWNPAVENQAADRAHRLGQQRPAASAENRPDPLVSCVLRKAGICNQGQGFVFQGHEQYSSGLMLLAIAVSLLLSQQPAAKPAPKVEIIRGGSKTRKAAPSTASTSDKDAELAAKEKALDARQKELDAKHQDLDAKNQALEARQRELDEREETAKAEKEQERKRQSEHQKAADRHSGEVNATMGSVTDALSGN